MGTLKLIAILALITVSLAGPAFADEGKDESEKRGDNKYSSNKYKDSDKYYEGKGNKDRKYSSDKKKDDFEGFYQGGEKGKNDKYYSGKDKDRDKYYKSKDDYGRDKNGRYYRNNNDRYSYFQRHSYERLNIPKGHYPPRGECRIWYPDRPAGQQPPPGNCRNAFPGAWVIRHPQDNPGRVYVDVFEPQYSGVYVTGEFDLGSGAFIRIEGGR